MDLFLLRAAIILFILVTIMYFADDWFVSKYPYHYDIYAFIGGVSTILLILDVVVMLWKMAQFFLP